MTVSQVSQVGNGNENLLTYAVLQNIQIFFSFPHLTTVPSSCPNFFLQCPDVILQTLAGPYKICRRSNRVDMSVEICSVCCNWWLKNSNCQATEGGEATDSYR